MDLSVEYSARTVLDGLAWRLDAGRIYSIIGPNGCGKSTLLQAIARQLKPSGGCVELDGTALSRFTPRQLAVRLAVLRQSQDKPPDVTVRTLVGYGRFPHKPAWSRMRAEDRDIVEWALTLTGTDVLADRKLSALSGGERQRVWIAMALAQRPRILLLDEPTTYLDVCHQLEIMEMIADINRNYGVTIVMVLHDINHAAAYSDEIAVLKEGRFYSNGTPEQTITARMFADVFGVKAIIQRDRETGRPTSRITGLADGRMRPQPLMAPSADGTDAKAEVGAGAAKAIIYEEGKIG
ncbi:ABC transporter ATP-binding protein [Paenibacillus ginsengarvi]|uniref:ABC transporter ATP-binding protein n=2 Tax=Paenibacillus ginsengarvi TaxID=400777 RepID=A0A3B0CEX9_9BACL|nr:ABC transporter ATP-binding protein [Paenibacillus ginsengarvi]